MNNHTIIHQVDIDRLPFAREGVLRAWSEKMGVEFNPDYLDEELTYDEELGHDHTIVGLVDAHNTLLQIQYTLDNNDVDVTLGDDEDEVSFVIQFLHPMQKLLALMSDRVRISDDPALSVLVEAMGSCFENLLAEWDEEPKFPAHNPYDLLRKIAGRLHGIDKGDLTKAEYQIAGHLHVNGYGKLTNTGFERI